MAYGRETLSWEGGRIYGLQYAESLLKEGLHIWQSSSSLKTDWQKLEQFYLSLIAISAKQPNKTHKQTWQVLLTIQSWVYKKTFRSHSDPDKHMMIKFDYLIILSQPRCQSKGSKISRWWHSSSPIVALPLRISLEWGHLHKSVPMLPNLNLHLHLFSSVSVNLFPAWYCGAVFAPPSLRSMIGPSRTDTF